MQYQYGFIYDYRTARAVAHELGHGEFNLPHTFAKPFIKEQGSTDNLMDYSNGTELWKHQWKLIQNPSSMLFKFLQDEGGAEMISSIDKDSISIKIESANFDFAPGTGKMEINYSLGKQTMNILKKYPSEKKELKIAIANKDGKFVHIESKEPSEKDIYTWNGVNTNGDTIKMSDEPYKVALTLIVGEETNWFDSWQSFKDKLYQSLKSDSVQRIVINVDTTFTIDPRRIEWEQYKDIRGFVAGGYDGYENLYDLYMEYDGVKAAGNPFEYIKQNTQMFTFLGKSIVVHKEFATILMKVEETLKQRGIYDRLKEKYKNDNTMWSTTMRTINDPQGGGKISEHGFGLAIDIGVNENPQIVGNQKPLVRFFIKKTTGFDLGVRKTSYLEVKNAHNKFISLYKNITNEELANKYAEIQKYQSDTNSVTINNLSAIDSDLRKIQEIYNKALQDSIGYTKLDSLKKEISLITNELDKLFSVIDLYKNTVIFEQPSVNSLNDLKQRVLLLKNHLIQLDFKNNTANFNPLYNTDINVVNEEISKFQAEVQQIDKSYKDLKVFGYALKSAITGIGYGNVLLKDGFCSIELEIIEAFLGSDPRIQWGGTFSTKIDAMHFGFTTSAAKDIVNNKK